MSESGQDCVARDDANQLEVRFSTTVVPVFEYTGPSAMAFAERTALPGEFMQPNPQFSTVPIPRNDGMMVQRFAFWYQRMTAPGAWGQPVATPPLEGYLTLAYRNGVLLTGSVRSLVPQIAWTGNRRWFPALAGLYATTFAYQ